jgi:hypothetical protein
MINPNFFEELSIGLDIFCFWKYPFYVFLRTCCSRRKENFSQQLKVRVMIEEIINDIINSVDGDYIFQAQVLAAMKPTGW